MNTWKKVMLFCLLPFAIIWHYAKKSTKYMERKTKPAMAMLMAVVMLCGMLPATVIAAGVDDVSDDGIGFHWGSSGFMNITMPTTEDYYTYGTASYWGSEELAVNVSTLPDSGWDWAVQKETTGYRLILNDLWLSYSGTSDWLMFKCPLTLELRGTNQLTANNAESVLSGNNITILGDGELILTGGKYGMNVSSATITTGTVTISASERAISISPTLQSGVYALVSENADGTNAQSYTTGSLDGKKWFKASYAAPGSTYTVSFYADEGTGTMANAENIVGAYTLPANNFTPPAGMLFKAWRVGGEEKAVGETILVTSRTYVTAVWEDDPDTFTVSFYSGGGSGYMEKVKAVVGAYTLPANGFTPPAGMQFKAWEVGGEEMAVGATINVAADTSVEAVWEDDPDTFAVYFDGNGSTSGHIDSVSNGSGTFTYTLPENNWPSAGFYEPSNRYFAGWLVDGTVMQPGDTITVTGDITVKAAWEIENYGLSVGGVGATYQNAHSITGTNITGTVSYDPVTQTLTLNNATIHSAHMGGTITSAIHTGYYHDGKLTIHLIGDNTVYGDPSGGAATSSHRYAIYTGELTFTGDGSLNVKASEADGGYFYNAIHSGNNIVVESGCTITAASNYGEALSSYNGALIANGSTVLASASATGTPLTAYGELGMNSKYVKIMPAYNITVSFDANGGTDTMENKVIVCAKEYTLPECGFTAPAGKQFKAWSVNGSEKAVGDKAYFIENTTITAVWEDATHTCNIQPVTKVWPTCENGGKEAYYKCEGCGKFFEDANGVTEIADIVAWGNLTKLGHTEGTAWEKDGSHHWHICSVAGCGAVIDSSKAVHTSTGANVATCQKAAVCDDCGVTYGTVTDHSSENILSKDDSGHWYACKTSGCTEKISFAPHTPDHQGNATEEYAIKCTICYHVIEQQLAHTHVFDKEVVDERYKASGANCTVPAKYYKSCACGEKGTETFENGSVAAHTPDRAAATENNPVKCAVCGYEITPVLSHTHAYGTGWKSDKDNHWNECACGHKAGTAAHKDENTDGKCDVCTYNIGVPTTSTGPQSPKTGDNSHVTLWLLLLFLSEIGIVVLENCRRKETVK